MSGKDITYEHRIYQYTNRRLFSLIVLSAIIVYFIIGICYSLGYTTVTPHMMDIPIILCAFFYPKRGIAAAILLSAGYILLAAALSGFSGIETIYATGRAFVFIAIGVAVSFLSAGLVSEKKRYSHLFNSLSDITYIAGRLEDGGIGDIIECNETTLKNTGYSQEEIIGKPVSVLTSGTTPTLENLKIWQESGKESDNNEIYVIESEHTRKDNSSYPVEMKIRSSSIDEKPVYVITARDISRRKEIEEKLISQATFLESLIETIPIPYLYKNSDLRHTMCNTSLLEFMNMEKDFFIGRTVFEVLPKEYADPIDKMDLETIATRRPVSGTVRVPGNNGEERTILMNMMAVFPDEDVFSGIITIFQDISDFKKVKEDLRRSLDEKTILLQEVHHRVKNNLSIIIGFLSMQKRVMDDEKCIEAITDAENRIYSLAAVHESIYLSETISEIDAQEHFENLISTILITFSEHPEVTGLVDAGGCKLDIRQAIPTSLIANEIITNSIKYAFKDRESGKVSLKLQKDDKGRYNMIVSDDGIGLPGDFDLSKSQTLGIKVINNIVKLQLKGEVTMTSGASGTTWDINWK